MTVGIKTYVCSIYTHACVDIPKHAPKTAEKEKTGQREQPHCLYSSEGMDSVLL